VAKYLPNGALDPSFAGDGKQTLDNGGTERANAIARAPDGKLVVAGHTSAGADPENFAVARLLDSLPVASIGDVAGVEGTDLQFPVTLNKPAGLGVDFQLNTADGSAVAPGDYDGGRSTAAFPPGATSTVAPVRTQLDRLFEADETFTATLGPNGPPTFTIADADATGTITNFVLTIRCGNDIFGTAASETINGTAFNDDIRGEAGNDRLNGLNGDDCLRGGTGKDNLQGGNGADDLRGDAGNDTMNGAKGKDKLLGGIGNDRLNGSRDADDLRGEAGNDNLTGTEGKDKLTGGDGNDSLSGGGDNDRLDGGKGADKINAGSGKNTVKGGSGNDNIATQNGKRDSVDCGAGRDRIRADRGDKLKNCEIRVSRR
jgi:Ca2+-binding RTX toxin-like protein